MSNHELEQLRQKVSTLYKVQSWVLVELGKVQAQVEAAIITLDQRQEAYGEAIYSLQQSVQEQAEELIERTTRQASAEEAWS